ncbi:MAG: phage-related integrase [Mycobacterium sp.]|jgi:integrase|nr:phage-related integrase [Mycobacterium sp.]
MFSRAGVRPRWPTSATPQSRRGSPNCPRNAGVLDDAVRDRMLAANPARGVKLPRRSKRPNVYLTAAQLHSLAMESGRYGSLVLVLGTVGLRWGEAAALRVSDVNFLRHRVVLHENAVAVGGRTHVGTLKAGHSRSVALPGSWSTGSRSPARARAAMNWSGRRRTAAIGPRRRTSRGWPVRSNAARRPIRPSRGSQRTLFVSLRRRWRSRRARM